MGSWFAAFLKKNGYEVNVYDKNERAARQLSARQRLRLAKTLDRAKEAQLIVLATPTRVTKQLLPVISANVRQNASIVEISSVKTPIKNTIIRLHKNGVPIVSIHPMFGPGAKTIVGRVVLTSVTPPNNRVAQEFLSLLRRKGAKLVPCPLKDHDRLASIILTLPHFINMIFVNALMASSVNPNRMRALAGTTFKLQLLIAEAIYQEDKENELSILLDNEYSLGTLKKLTREAASLIDAVKKRRTRHIILTLAKGRKFVRKEKDFSTSYRRFNDAVEVSSRR